MVLAYARRLRRRLERSSKSKLFPLASSSVIQHRILSSLMGLADDCSGGAKYRPRGPSAYDIHRRHFFTTFIEEIGCVACLFVCSAQFGPMRFADSLIRDNHELTDSLNVLRLEIMRSDAGFPINVYGTVIVRYRLDLKCMYIFRRDRDNCQLVQAKGEYLILTGPSRGIVFHSDAYFEIDLKIKKDTEIRDEQFCKALTDIDVGKFESNNFIKRKTVVSWLSEVDLVLAYVRKALEGTIEIQILSGPEAFFGKLTACTTDVSTPIISYDSDLDDRNTLGNERVIQPLRHVVAVSADRMLIIHAYASGGGHTGSCDFTPLIKGPDKTQITCGAYKLQVKVIWSTLLDE